MGFDSHENNGSADTCVTLKIDGTSFSTSHGGVGPVEALVEALAAHGRHVEILGLTQTSVRAGNDSDAVTLLEYRTAAGSGWAAGIDRSVLSATLDAVVRAANVVT
ncbi:hypothetical protein CH305_05565 [Rhodococcus sp. 15-649-2-2]|uniref:alpha-isopropylmalate synthase regulatory domain-containing protein n=1 Tax=Rhodococcus sp. 15-649-2-2 TaxID=2023140 RepID=UPI000B9BC096|nr:alpha-isopropylmalate synthase regulatory domain-containing protein [Rhodococcus sp. 15-649-2-2]OZE83922.1 hypothetical protein CH305_05565 [Rhodococcus sp. 15-649-2-2]